MKAEPRTPNITAITMKITTGYGDFFNIYVKITLKNKKHI